MRVVLPVILLFAAPTFLGADEKAWQEARRLGLSQWQNGYYGSAESRLAKAAKEAEAFGEKDVRLAETLLELARIELFNGAYVKAERHATRSQQLLEKLHGPEHVSTAPAIRIRAETAAALGQSGAEKIAVEALKICLKHADAQPLFLAEAYEALARVSWLYERSSESVRWPVKGPVLPKALAIREKLYGKNDLRLLPWFLIYSTDGQRESIPDPTTNLERAKAIVEKHRKYDEHSDMADVLTRLAAVEIHYGTYKSRDYAEADKLLTKALEIWRWESEEKPPPRSAAAWRALGELRLAQKKLAESERAFNTALQAHFSRLSDEELCESYLKANPARHFLFPDRSTIGKDAYLTEMVQRGGAIIETFLQKRFQELVKAAEKDRYTSANLEVLIALRRIERKKDPLQITYSGHEDAECIFPILPRFDVTITNQDTEPVMFTHGGDYRSGRLARWRFDVRDPKGNLMDVHHFEGWIGGGMFQRGELKPRDTWDCRLDMNHYLDLLPGTYTVRILYHDQSTIAEMPLPTGMMVCRSKPFRLHVQPRVIDITPEEKKILTALVPLLDDKGPVRMVGRKYDIKAHQFLPPDSVAGMLLSRGWKAVPFLIDELEKPSLTPIQCGWALGILSDITGRNHVQTDIVGDYRFLPWENERDAETEKGKRREYKIDACKQKEHIRRWQEFRTHLVVRVAAAEQPMGKSKRQP